MFSLNRQLIISFILGAAIALPVVTFAEVSSVVEITSDPAALPEIVSASGLRDFRNINRPDLVQAAIYDTRNFDLAVRGNVGSTARVFVVDYENSRFKAILTDSYYKRLVSAGIVKLAYWRKNPKDNVRLAMVFLSGRGAERNLGFVGKLVFKPGDFGYYDYSGFKRKASADFAASISFDEGLGTVTFDLNSTGEIGKPK